MCAVLEQLGDRALHVHVDAEIDRALLQGADHLQAGAVTDVGEPRVAVATEVALRDLAVLGAVEQRAVLLELPDPLGRLLGVQLRHAPVVEHLAAAHGVAEVDLPVVLGPDVAHGGGDAALGHDGVRLAEQRLGDDRGARTGLVRGDRGAQPGAAGADDDDVVVVSLVTPSVHRAEDVVVVVQVAGRDQPDVEVDERDPDQRRPGPADVVLVQPGHERPPLVAERVLGEVVDPARR